MTNRKLWLLTFLALLLTLATTACWRSQTPPAPNMAGGDYEYTGYQFFQWQEGLDIMLWHTSVPDSTCDSSSDTSVDITLVQCQLRTADGFEFAWQINTEDGRTAEFMLDGQPYDLADGNLFLITIENGVLDVQQMERDLSGVAANHDGVTQFGLADPDISQFIEAATPEN